LRFLLIGEAGVEGLRAWGYRLKAKALGYRLEV
jgi:hypothetical protein